MEGSGGLSGRERMFRKLRGEAADRTPVFSANQTGTYDQMEKVGAWWPEANRTAGPMAGLAAGAYTVVGFDAVRVPFCQTVEAEALGCTLKDGGAKSLPSPAVHPYKVGETPEFPGDFLSRGRIPQLVEAVRLLKSQLGGQVMVIGGIIGPFSIAGSLVGTPDLLKTSFKKPHLLEPLLEVAERAGTALGKALIEAGADAVCIEDMMASLDMISPKIYREVVAPWERRQVAALAGVPVIIHICGNLDDVIDDIAAMEVSGISVETKINAPKAKEKLGRYSQYKALIGGVDAVHTLFSGTPEKVKQEVAKALADGYDMIAPGCAIPPATTIEMLRAMVEGVSAPA